MDPAVAERLERVTGSGIRDARSMGGQHGAAHFRLELADGRELQTGHQHAAHCCGCGNEPLGCGAESFKLRSEAIHRDRGLTTSVAHSTSQGRLFTSVDALTTNVNTGRLRLLTRTSGSGRRPMRSDDEDHRYP